jgi:hypothetical protein
MCLRQRRLFSLESTEFSRVFFFLPRGTVRVARPPKRSCLHKSAVLGVGNRDAFALDQSLAERVGTRGDRKKATRIYGRCWCRERCAFRCSDGRPRKLALLGASQAQGGPSGALASRETLRRIVHGAPFKPKQGCGPCSCTPPAKTVGRALTLTAPAPRS